MSARRRDAGPGTVLPSPLWLVDRILHRDGLILIIDKPAGVPVHAGSGGGINLEHYFEALRFGLPQPPALAHRLDRDTSGCLVLGRHRKALARVGRLFQNGQVEKVYWTVVRGRPPADAGTVDLPLRKRSEVRGWWMEPHPDGQASRTDYRVLGEGEGITWLECRPRTGRTHQIRVHCAELGCPVLGDPIYGRDGGAAPVEPLHLHARSIALPLYPNRAAVTAVAAPPDHMVAALTRCGYDGAGEPSAAPGHVSEDAIQAGREACST